MCYSLSLSAKGLSSSRQGGQAFCPCQFSPKGACCGGFGYWNGFVVVGLGVMEGFIVV